MLKGKYALVTGATGGIGRAIVLTLAKNGANVIAHARKETPAFLAQLAEIETTYGVSVLPVYFDMTDSVAMKEAIRGLAHAKIAVDILVNNAGMAHGGLFQMTSMAKVREVFDVNLFSHMELTQLLLRPMIKRQCGAIVNIASISGMDLKLGNSAYGVSKAALIAFTKTLAAECGEHGVRVNAIAPGLVDTEMAGLMEDHAAREMIAGSAMKRLGTPDEIAETVVFLASDHATFINGQVMRVDGGSV